LLYEKLFVEKDLLNLHATFWHELFLLKPDAAKFNEICGGSDVYGLKDSFHSFISNAISVLVDCDSTELQVTHVFEVCVVLCCYIYLSRI
jgi:hypothetical protein